MKRRRSSEPSADFDLFLNATGEPLSTADVCLMILLPLLRHPTARPADELIGFLRLQQLLSNDQARTRLLQLQQAGHTFRGIDELYRTCKDALRKRSWAHGASRKTALRQLLRQYRQAFPLDSPFFVDKSAHHGIGLFINRDTTVAPQSCLEPDFLYGHCWLPTEEQLRLLEADHTSSWPDFYPGAVEVCCTPREWQRPLISPASKHSRGLAQKRKAAMFGLLSLVNHSDQSAFIFQLDSNTKKVYAFNDTEESVVLRTGQEICVRYW